jgi:hypothetical protein
MGSPHLCHHTGHACSTPEKPRSQGCGGGATRELDQALGKEGTQAQARAEERSCWGWC